MEVPFHASGSWRKRGFASSGAGSDLLVGKDHAEAQD